MAEQVPEGLAAPGDGKEPSADTSLVSARSQALAEIPGQELICGVDRALIESFLNLVRDNYKRADAATFFLEQRSGYVNIQGITNVRDVLSHLVTLLSPDTPPEKRQEQLYNAEEHLRRSINEPYEIALNELTVRFSKLYEDYKALVLPIKERYPVLRDAPTGAEIETVLHEARKLTSQGRASKANNLWTAEWEDGVICFTQAFDLLFKLHHNMESFHLQALQMEQERAEVVTIQALRSEVLALQDQVKKESFASKRFHLGGYALAIVLAIVSFILAAILALVLYFYPH